jgi:hypothetical protein
MKNFITLVAVLSVAGLAGLADASADGFDLRVQVQGHVSPECVLSATPTFQSFGPQRHLIGTLDRFCNAPHSLSFSHSGQAQTGRLVIGGSSGALAQNSTMVISQSGPIQQTSNIFIEGVDAETAQNVAASLNFRVTPSSF